MDNNIVLYFETQYGCWVVYSREHEEIEQYNDKEAENIVQKLIRTGVDPDNIHITRPVGFTTDVSVRIKKP